MDFVVVVFLVLVVVICDRLEKNVVRTGGFRGVGGNKKTINNVYTNKGAL